MEDLEKLAWPVVALIAFTIFVVVFKSPISTLILRIRSIKKDGIDTGPATTQPDSETQKESESLKRVADSPLLIEAENSIKTDLKKKGLESKGDTIEVLITHLAQSQINAEFERIYRLIFGSQIRILKNSNTPSGLSGDMVKAFYSELVLEKKPFYDGHSFDAYIGFLKSQSLILENSGCYFSTVKGQAFLEWLVRSQISENKAF